MDDRAERSRDLPDLVRRAAAGDQTSWDTITERFNGLLWSVARSHRLSPADAADVVQNTWLRLVEHLDRIREPERLAGWLAMTARNESLTVLRRSSRQSVSRFGEVMDDSADPDAVPVDLSLLTDERDVALWRCFERLSAACQQLLRVLMAADPPSYAEVSQSLGMPVGSIGPTRLRCLNRLRTVLGESAYPFGHESR